MEQIAVSFTDGGVPKTGLNPVVTIIDRTGKKYVENGLLTELGYGWYIYNFERYSPEKTYLYMFDGGNELSSDYDRYKFGGNEFDAYSNKYSWGRTAAPYFTSINSRFNNVDKAINDAVKSRKEYKDDKVIKGLADIKKEIKGKGGYDVYKRLDGLGKVLEEVKKSVVDTSSTNDGNNSKNFTGINEKLDLMAEYVVKIKGEIDNELNTVGDVIQQSIQESNTNLNEGLSSRVTIEQLLQQVNRLEEKLNEVVDSVVSKRLPRELTDKYDLNVMRKPNMSEEDVARALGLDMGLNEGMSQGIGEGVGEGIEEGMNEGLDEGIGQAREMGSNAPVDMQGIAEPVMPNAM